MPSDPRSSPLALAVLGLLYGGPLHPYRMQRLLKDWGKDQVINVGQRSSLYKTIKRLDQLGLITVHGTSREQAYPERTVYTITNPGRELLMQWLDEMLSTPRREFPQFPAALSFAMLLGPDNTLTALERRHASLRQALESIDAELARHTPALPRVALLETEYHRAITAAELAWLEQIIRDLQTGAAAWTRADLAGSNAAYILDDTPRAKNTPDQR